MFAVVDLSLASKKFWHEEDVRAEMYFFGPFLEDEISLWRIRTFSMVFHVKVPSNSIEATLSIIPWISMGKKPQQIITIMNYIFDLQQTTAISV